MTSDLRLVAPAVAAWTAGWLVVAAPDIGLSAWWVVAAAWSAACVMLAVLVLLRVRSGRRARISAQPAPTAQAGVGAHLLPAVMRIAAATLVAAAAAALVATSAGAALETRARSPLAEAASSGRMVRVVVELTAAPRAMTAPWFGSGADGGAAPELPQRIEGKAVDVDGAAVAAVPVTATVDLAPSLLQLGTTLTFDANAATLPSAESTAFRLRVAGDVEVAPPTPWLAWSGSLRTGFAESAGALGGDGGALVPGLAIGDTSAVGEQLDAAMKASSLARI